MKRDPHESLREAMIPPRIIPKAAVVNERYEVQGLLGAHGTLEMILALDRGRPP